MRADELPADDAELWLRLAAGVVSPQGSDDWAGPGEGPSGGLDGELDETDSAVAAICAIEHFDWLAVITALAVGGPGTPATAATMTSATSMRMRTSTSSPWRACSFRSPRCGRCWARSTTRTA